MAVGCKGSMRSCPNSSVGFGVRSQNMVSMHWLIEAMVVGHFVGW